MENYSLSDLRAATEGNDAFGGNGAWWIILLFLFWGFNGNNRVGEYGQFATAASQQEILFGQQFAQLNDRLTSISNGICDSTYALNNSITNEGRSLSAQLAQCCCDNRLATANLAAQMDRQTCDITTAIHAEAEATRALIQTNEIQALRDKVADLQLAQSQCAQNAYLVNQLKPCAIPAYIAPNPYCNYNYNNCNCGNI